MGNNLLKEIKSFVIDLDLKVSGRIFFYSAVVGLVAGLGSIAFHTMCQGTAFLFQDLIAGYRPPEPAGEHHIFGASATLFRPYLLIIIPAVGGLLSGLIVYSLAPEAEGDGIDTVINAYHRGRGIIRGRLPFVKSVASAITLGSGGSGGREGPIAQIGAGFGSYLGRVLKVSERERRILMIAGVGGGLGSIFRAPLAGALFAAEVLYRDPEFDSDAVIPSMISSIIAYCVFSLQVGWGHLFQISDAQFTNPLELFPYSALAIVVALAAVLYVKCFYGVFRISHRVKILPHVKPAIGGLLTGLLAFGLYKATDSMGVLSVLSFGYGGLQEAMDGKLAIWVCLIIALGKILTTSLSISSGGSGGVFGPSVVIGGCLGGAVGLFLHGHFPGLVAHPEAYVVVGMAGFFGAAANVPVSALFMVSEITGSYNLLMPSMWVCTIAYLLVRKWSIYAKQVKGFPESQAHRGEFIVAILEGITVRDVMNVERKPVTVPEDTPLTEILKLISSTHQTYFPVVDKEGLMKGIFSMNDVRGVLFDEGLRKFVVAQDICVSDVITVTPDEDLDSALSKFTVKNFDELPVVDAANPRKIVGVLRRRDAIQAYNVRLHEVKEEEGGESGAGEAAG